MLRTMRPLWAVGLAALAAAACATVEGYEQRLNLLMGMHSDDLVVRWGVPDRSVQLKDGREMLEYESRRLAETGGGCYDQERTVVDRITRADGTVDKVERTVITPYCTEPTLTEYVCITRFVIGLDSRVQEWAHEGNDCVAVPLN